MCSLWTIFRKKRRRPEETQPPKPIEDRTIPPINPNWTFFSDDVLVTLNDGKEYPGFYNHEQKEWRVLIAGETQPIPASRVKGWREWKEAYQ